MNFIDFIWDWFKNMAVLFSIVTLIYVAHFVAPTLEMVAADIKVIRATCTQQPPPAGVEAATLPKKTSNGNAEDCSVNSNIGIAHISRSGVIGILIGLFIGTASLPLQWKLWRKIFD